MQSLAWLQNVQHILSHPFPPDRVYYRLSSEREKEIRQAYKNQSRFIARNVTGLIHAVMIKKLQPDMEVIVQPDALNPREWFHFWQLQQFIDEHHLLSGGISGTSDS